MTESEKDPTSNQDGVMWRNLGLSFIITLVVSLIARITFSFIPDNILFNDFLAGWIGCLTWFSCMAFYDT